MSRLHRKRTLPLLLSVVLSFRNEEAVIPELVRRLREVLAGQKESGALSSYELVFVDDASTDRSGEVLDAITDDDDIVIVELSRNFGPSEGVMAGLAHSKGDAIIYMDSDLQDPPEVIPALIERFIADDQIDVVYTTRRKRDGEHPLKLLLTKVGYRLVNYISEIELPVDSGDFKLLSRRVVDQLLTFEEKKPYMRGLVSWVGFKQEQVFYDRAERYDGPGMTKCPVLSRKVMDGYLDRALISFSDVPLKISLLLG